MPDKLWEEPLQRGGDFGTIFDAIGTTLATAYGGTGQRAKCIAAELVRRANAYPRLIALLTEALQLKGGWREAIALTEDLTANPVYLKNMMAAIDQIDEWSKFARAALAEADHE